MNAPSPSIAVIILNWNGKEDTLACLTSLYQNTYSSFEAIVVDNHSSDGSVEAISALFPQVTLLSLLSNLGYAGGNNRGIVHALEKGVDFILLLNNDTVVHPSFLQNLLQETARFPNSGIFGARPLLFSSPQKLDHLGGKWNPRKGLFDLIGLKENTDFHTTEDLDYVCGCSILIKKQVFEKIGLLENDYFLFWEEADFCVKAKKAGFLVSVCHTALLLHKVSSSFTGGTAHKIYFWWRSRLLWIARNCSKKEKFFLFFRVLLPEVGKIYKLWIIKSIELGILKLLFRKRDFTKKCLKLKEYRAAVQGCYDFQKKRFGRGPAWIFSKPQEGRENHE